MTLSAMNEAGIRGGCTSACTYPFEHVYATNSRMVGYASSDAQLEPHRHRKCLSFRFVVKLVADEYPFVLPFTCSINSPSLRTDLFRNKFLPVLNEISNIEIFMQIHSI